MKRRNLMKQILCVALSAVMLYGISGISASAKGKYPDKDMFEYLEADQGSTYKGVQGKIDKYAYGENSHTLLNFNITPHIYTDGKDENVFVYDGETYYFEFEFAHNVNWNARQCNNGNMSCSIVFLITWDDVNQYLIDEGARASGHTYYMPASGDTKGGKALRAYWHFLMKKLDENGIRIDNFILGNEVNMPNQWCYSGSTDVNVVAGKYAAAFYDMYTAVREYSRESRCSVSIDHSWNDSDQGNGIPARDFLNSFDAALTNLNGGKKIDDWCVSAHAYPAILTQPAIWNSGLNPVDPDARFVDGKNLSVMTNYIRDTFGESHRVMLTEQGFLRGDERVQAAALAYTYYAAKYDPMVDCMILNIENAKENFSIDGTLAEQVWTRIDGPNTTAEDEKWVADTCLPVIGAASWADIIPHFGEEKVRDKFAIVDGKGVLYKGAEINREYNGWYTYQDKKYLLKEGQELDIPKQGSLPDKYNGWFVGEKAGKSYVYWADNGVMARDKEVYDGLTDGWYWFDADGTMAVDKDAFVATNPERTEGKWVHYDENGVMAKGVFLNEKNGKWYRFDVITGEMIKGWFPDGDQKYYYDDITGTLVYGAHEAKDGLTYKFDEQTGVCQGIADLCWCVFDGKEYWYEKGIRQGYDPADKGYRGKEIYDPETNAWYWLDNVDQGKKAVSKDVYQDSLAGESGDYILVGADGELLGKNKKAEPEEIRAAISAGGKITDKDKVAAADPSVRYGKWVRYDAEGKMIKGWCAGKRENAVVINSPEEANGRDVYYFEKVYGTMAKGEVVIDGKTYYFDPVTGVMQ